MATMLELATAKIAAAQAATSAPAAQSAAPSEVRSGAWKVANYTNKTGRRIGWVQPIEEMKIPSPNGLQPAKVLAILDDAKATAQAIRAVCAASLADLQASAVPPPPAAPMVPPPPAAQSFPMACNGKMLASMTIDAGKKAKATHYYDGSAWQTL